MGYFLQRVNRKMTKPLNLYICDLPVEFPRSEYGGMVAVIAESPKQCGKILTERFKGNELYFDLRIAMRSPKEFKLDPAVTYEPGIVASFET
jgi:hypothetical protein